MMMNVISAFFCGLTTGIFAMAVSAGLSKWVWGSNLFAALLNAGVLAHALGAF